MIIVLLNYEHSNSFHDADDLKSWETDGTLQTYDAFVLFSEEDREFVDNVVEKMEGEFGLKVLLLIHFGPQWTKTVFKVFMGFKLSGEFPATWKMPLFMVSDIQGKPFFPF